MNLNQKPLGIKNYGSIPHLPGSRLGPGDHHCHDGQAVICTERARDKHDRIIVTEKLDGSNCGVAKVNSEIIALGRAGYRAETSRFEQHLMFAQWVDSQRERFADLLHEGERCVGEWLAQAHGTRYKLPHEPFIVFDLMNGTSRCSFDELAARCSLVRLGLPRIISDGDPLSIRFALDAIQVSGHGAIDPVEGAVWRVERKGHFDFMAKYVRPEKKDGYYLPEISGVDAVWNWRPS